MIKMLEAKIGDTVYIQQEYNLESVKLVGIGPKNYRVEYPNGYRKSVKVEKLASSEESIAVVWETWRGHNGRGGYRLEKSLYPEYRKQARLWSHQSRIPESSFGVIDQKLLPLFLGQ